MNMLSESLKANDLRHFVTKVFEVDAFKSKIGDDEDVVVVSFTVDGEDPANDLENFIEMGYDFVLDADTSPGETEDGNYKVFVELERGKHVAKQISEILDGVKKLTGMDSFRFRYFKGFKSHDATEENLADLIPMDGRSYEIATARSNLNNFTTFFSNSYADKVDVVDESITFKKAYKEPLTFKIVSDGPKADVYSSIAGPIMMESKDIAEVMFLTKTIGDYNITKVGKNFIFENKGYAVALEKK